MGSKTDEVRCYISNVLQTAKLEGFATKDIRAGDIKRDLHLGNVPQLVCNAMRSIPNFTKYDVLFSPPNGNSTTLLFRYYLDEAHLPSDFCANSENHLQNHGVNVRKSVRHLEKEIDIDNILGNVHIFYNKLSTTENHRYRSWEHCYSFFQKHQTADNEEMLDLMCLHLSNYLASWGMFRGAAFLLQKDYKVHYDVVRLMLEEKYQVLRSTNIQTIISTDEYTKKMFELSQKIAEIYRKKTTDFENENGRDSSDTLITKILLGVFGCTPAYDRYFKAGLRSTKIASGQYTVRSISQLLHFYNENIIAFDAIRFEISKNSVEYPPMKIIDMCFWQIGYDQDIQLQEKRKHKENL
ncbi:MAG: hypothetical protein RR413_09345 [Christensenellaceae bacterium]